MKKSLFVLLLSFISGSLFSQDSIIGRNYLNPMEHTVLISGNFGEPRRNHFHSGVDFRTESVQGKPIRSVEDGYVSRIGVSPIGYGNVLYVTHPKTGETSVYAHIRNFSKKVEEVLRTYQYEHEQASVDFEIDSTSLPVKRGEVIAYSGNSGSSGGPHLHFEFRDTETNDFIDPALYGMGISDDIKPKLYALRIYPQPNEGIANGLTTNRNYTLTSPYGVGKFAQTTYIQAWGKIGLGLKMIDYSNNSGNTLGVHSVQMEVDGKVVFLYKNDRFNINDTRYLNSVFDYDFFRRNKAFVFRAYREKGCHLNCYPTLVNDGIITIDEERKYHIKFTIKDTFGNTTTFDFDITGKKQDIPQKTQSGIFMNCDSTNVFTAQDVQMTIPNGMLYSDLFFQHKEEISTSFLSNYHTLGDDLIPLHTWCDVALKPTKEINDSSKLVAIRIDSRGYNVPLLGEYRDSMFHFRTREFGKFVLKADSIAPTITLTHISNLVQYPYISFTIGDNLSGIKSYRGCIDGKWVLFEQTGSSIRYYLNANDIERHHSHNLVLTVTDNVGNERVYKQSFWW